MAHSQLNKCLGMGKMKKVLFLVVLLFLTASCSKVSELIDLASTENLTDILTEMPTTVNVVVEPEPVSQEGLEETVLDVVQSEDFMKEVVSTVNHNVIEEVVTEIIQEEEVVQQLTQLVEGITEEFATVLDPYSDSWIDTGLTLELGDTVTLTARGAFICPSRPDYDSTDHTTVFGYVWEGYSPALKDRPFVLAYKVGDTVFGPSSSISQLNDELSSGKLTSPDTGVLYVKINSVQEIEIFGSLDILLKKD